MSGTDGHLFGWGAQRVIPAAKVMADRRGLGAILGIALSGVGEWSFFTRQDLMVRRMIGILVHVMRRYRWVIMLLLVLTLVAASAGLWWVSREPTTLILSAGQPGGTYLPLAEAIARMVQEDNPRIRIKVVTSSGGMENLQRLEAGQAQLALTQNDAAGGAQIRTLTPLYQEMLHFLTRRDLSIQGIRDLTGKTVAVGQRGSGTEMLFHHVLKHYGLTYEDFQPQFIGPGEAVDQLAAGQLDAMVFMAGLRSAACTRAINTGKIRFVSIGRPDPVGSEVDGIRVDYPFISQAVIPALAYATTAVPDGGEPQQAVATLGVQSILACRSDLPRPLAYAITRSLFQHRSILIRDLPIAAQITEQFDPALLQFSLHMGAQQFYRRREPGFLVTYAEPMAFILSGMIATFALISAIREWARRRKKNRIDTYYLRLLSILDQLRHNDLSDDHLARIRRELTGMHHQAFEQLVEEALLADDSFQIFQAMIIDCQRQLDRRLGLKPS